MLKELFRAQPVQDAIGGSLGAYFKWVKATNPIAFMEPSDRDEIADKNWPLILVMWHGQHFMAPLGMIPNRRVAVLISRHGDGELNASVAGRLGLELIRGSGGRPEQMLKKGGIEAMHEMLRALEDGVSVALTADRPKRARIAGMGPVQLAAYSGRPIVPFAVATTRRFAFNNWDRSSVGLPHGRAAAVYSLPMRLKPDADGPALEAMRRAVELELDRVHRRAFELVGGRDPGEQLSRARRAESERRATEVS